LLAFIHGCLGLADTDLEGAGDNNSLFADKTMASQLPVMNPSISGPQYTESSSECPELNVPQANGGLGIHNSNEDMNNIPLPQIYPATGDILQDCQREPGNFGMLPGIAAEMINPSFGPAFRMYQNVALDMASEGQVGSGISQSTPMNLDHEFCEALQMKSQQAMEQVESDAGEQILDYTMASGDDDGQLEIAHDAADDADRISDADMGTYVDNFPNSRQSHQSIHEESPDVAIEQILDHTMASGDDYGQLEIAHDTAHDADRISGADMGTYVDNFPNSRQSHQSIHEESLDVAIEQILDHTMASGDDDGQLEFAHDAADDADRISGADIGTYVDNFPNSRQSHQSIHEESPDVAIEQILDHTMASGDDDGQLEFANDPGDVGDFALPGAEPQTFTLREESPDFAMASGQDEGRTDVGTMLLALEKDAGGEIVKFPPPDVKQDAEAFSIPQIDSDISADADDEAESESLGEETPKIAEAETTGFAEDINGMSKPPLPFHQRRPHFAVALGESGGGQPYVGVQFVPDDVVGFALSEYDAEINGLVEGVNDPKPFSPPRRFHEESQQSEINELKFRSNTPSVRRVEIYVEKNEEPYYATLSDVHPHDSHEQSAGFATVLGATAETTAFIEDADDFNFEILNVDSINFAPTRDFHVENSDFQMALGESGNAETTGFAEDVDDVNFAIPDPKPLQLKTPPPFHQENALEGAAFIGEVDESADFAMGGSTDVGHFDYAAETTAFIEEVDDFNFNFESPNLKPLKPSSPFAMALSGSGSGHLGGNKIIGLAENVHDVNLTPAHETPEENTDFSMTLVANGEGRLGAETTGFAEDVDDVNFVLPIPDPKPLLVDEENRDNFTTALDPNGEGGELDDVNYAIPQPKRPPSIHEVIPNDFGMALGPSDEGEGELGAEMVGFAENVDDGAEMVGFAEDVDDVNFAISHPKPPPSFHEVNPNDFGMALGPSDEGEGELGAEMVGFAENVDDGAEMVGFAEDVDDVISHPKPPPSFHEVNPNDFGMALGPSDEGEGELGAEMVGPTEDVDANNFGMALGPSDEGEGELGAEMVGFAEDVNDVNFAISHPKPPSFHEVDPNNFGMALGPSDEGEGELGAEMVGFAEDVDDVNFAISHPKPPPSFHEVNPNDFGMALGPSDEGEGELGAEMVGFTEDVDDINFAISHPKPPPSFHEVNPDDFGMALGPSDEGEGELGAEMVGFTEDVDDINFAISHPKPPPSFHEFSPNDFGMALGPSGEGEGELGAKTVGFAEYADDVDFAIPDPKPLQLKTPPPFHQENPAFPMDLGESGEGQPYIGVPFLADDGVVFALSEYDNGLAEDITVPKPFSPQRFHEESQQSENDEMKFRSNTPSVRRDPLISKGKQKAIEIYVDESADFAMGACDYALETTAFIEDVNKFNFAIPDPKPLKSPPSFATASGGGGEEYFGVTPTVGLAEDEVNDVNFAMPAIPLRRFHDQSYQSRDDGTKSRSNTASVRRDPLISKGKKRAIEVNVEDADSDLDIDETSSDGGGDSSSSEESTQTEEDEQLTNIDMEEHRATQYLAFHIEDGNDVGWAVDDGTYEPHPPPPDPGRRLDNSAGTMSNLQVSPVFAPWFMLRKFQHH
jgi:hypothetical protein